VEYAKKTCIALHGISELRSVTCHMGSHSVTCHPTQVNVPRLNPSHAGRYSIYLPRRDGRLSWPCYSETQTPGVDLATSRSRIQRPNHWATKQHLNIFNDCIVLKTFLFALCSGALSLRLNRAAHKYTTFRTDFTDTRTALRLFSVSVFFLVFSCCHFLPFFWLRSLISRITVCFLIFIFLLFFSSI